MKFLYRAKIVFFLLVFLIPLNLGRHFIIVDSYVYGKLVDYLIPTVYVQDLLAVILLVFWVISIFLRKIPCRDFFRKDFQLIWLFLFAVFLSVIISTKPIPSLVSFIRTSLYALVAVFIAVEMDFKKDFQLFKKLSFVSLFLVSLLGIAQFIKQGSLFGNYILFGEQPYSVKTPGIIQEYVLGRYYIPSYSLFRHPNIFSGYLVILLILLLGFLVRRINVINKKEDLILTIGFLNGRSAIFYYLIFLLGIVSLIFTLSIFSYICFLLALILFFIPDSKNKILYGISVIIFIFGLMLPVFRTNKLLSGYASFYRRSDLLSSSYKIIKKHPLFGIGYGAVTSIIEENLTNHSLVRFVQPVHNIFILIFVESGIFAFLLFLALFVASLYKSNKRKILQLSLFSVLFLGSFDHYFLTIHQTQLLFWMIIGWCLIDDAIYEYN